MTRRALTALRRLCAKLAQFASLMAQPDPVSLCTLDPVLRDLDQRIAKAKAAKQRWSHYQQRKVARVAQILAGQG